jgi:hypothetical protein
VITVQQFPSYELYRFLATEREREIQRIAREREVRHQPRQSTRQAIGRSIVRVGEAVAADPGFTPARSP